MYFWFIINVVDFNLGYENKQNDMSKIARENLMIDKKHSVTKIDFNQTLKMYK